MRTPSIPVFPFAVALSAILVLLSIIPSANAGQVISDELHQWAQQAVKQEAALTLKPTDNAVAVLYFHNQTGQADLDFLQMGMAIMLITDLAKVQGVQVVERARLQALVQELKLGGSGLVTSESAPRVGRLLGARYLVGGDLNNAPSKNIAIDSNLLSVPKGSALGNPSSSGPFAEMLRLEKEILFEIIRLLRIELTEAQKEELRKPFTSDIKALMFLVRGIQSSDRGAYDEAAAFYRKALQIDPNLAPARSASDELGHLGLTKPPRPDGKPLLNALRDRVSVNRSLIPGQTTKRRFWEPVSVLGPAGTASADVLIQWR